jgi:hypothetical protein
MKNIESRETPNTEVDTNQKIVKTIDSLFTSYKKIKTNYIDSQESVGRLFNKIGNLLDKHGETNSYEYHHEKFDDRILDIKENSYWFRIFEEDREKATVRIEKKFNGYGSLVFNLNENSIMICSEMKHDQRYSFNEIGINRINSLIDLIEEKKQKEKNEQLCQKSFFEEVNNLQFGRAFTKFFKEKIDPEDRKLDSEKKGKILGENNNSSVPFKIILSSSNGPSVSTNYETGDMEIRKTPLYMEVLYYEKTILAFGTTKPIKSDQKEDKTSLDLWIKDGNFSLLPESKSNVFLDMIQDFRNKLSEYQENVESSSAMKREDGGAGDGGGAGSR